MLPDYNKSIVSIASSVLSHFGAQTHHKTLSELDVLLDKQPKNVVVMLFDGMGTEIIKKHLPKDAFLTRHMLFPVSSVFPPTTTAATTSIYSGLTPAEHGWLGWTLYFDETDRNVDIFPNTLAYTDGIPADRYNVAKRFLPYRSICEKITEATGGKVAAHTVSEFTDDIKRSTLEEICTAVKDLCEGDGKNFIYAYYIQPDADIHEHGVGSDVAAKQIMAINSAVEKLASSVKDTLIAVTADHGLIDTEWRFLPEYPSVLDCLARDPSIESRAMTFFIKPGKEAKFEREFNRFFGDCFRLMTHSEVIESRLFGDGAPHPHTERFIGDYLALATGNVSIEVRGRSDRMMKAHHAGTTKDEMLVPFIAIET